MESYRPLYVTTEREDKPTHELRGLAFLLAILGAYGSSPRSPSASARQRVGGRGRDARARRRDHVSGTEEVAAIAPRIPAKHLEDGSR